MMGKKNSPDAEKSESGATGGVGLGDKSDAELLESMFGKAAGDIIREEMKTKAKEAKYESKLSSSDKGFGPKQSTQASSSSSSSSSQPAPSTKPSTPAVGTGALLSDEQVISLMNDASETNSDPPQEVYDYLNALGDTDFESFMNKLDDTNEKFLDKIVSDISKGMLKGSEVRHHIDM
jgi:hypothetical protein